MSASRTGAASDRRLVQCLSTDAKERGACIAQQTASDGLRLLEMRKGEYADAGRMHEWESIADSASKTMERYTPTAWMELMGMAKHVPLRDLLLLNTDYEMSMGAPGRVHDKCTGYAYSGPSLTIGGQTNDEDPSLWLDGDVDVVLRLNDALIYTHPLYLAYTGINRFGLIVTWQYIDDGERDLHGGVPTQALLRELLAQERLADAVSLLKRVPHAVPNNFLLVQDGAGSVNAECSPVGGATVVWSQHDIVHTNHVIFDQSMSDKDIGVHVSKTSVPRYNFMRTALTNWARADMNVSTLKSLFSGECCDEGVFRPVTLATMVMQSKPNVAVMDIRFKSDPINQFHRFEIAKEDGQNQDGDDLTKAVVL